MKTAISVVISIFCIVILFACGSTSQNVIVPVQDSQKSDLIDSDYAIRPGDQLEIKFFYNPELNENVLVRPDGKISLQLIDEVDTAGLSPSALDKILTEKYSKDLRKPVITVIVRAIEGYNVYVGGEVANEGIYRLNAGTNPLQAVFEAGGFLESASPENAIIIRKGQDNNLYSVGINLSDALKGKSKNTVVYLQPYDVVYIPKSAIAEANTFVRQYVQDLLLFRGWSFGITYEVFKKDYN